MSWDFAEENGCLIEETCDAFILGDGNITQSRARTCARCTIGNPSITELTCDFHVLNRSLRPLVLGMPFLHSLRLLCGTYCDRQSCMDQALLYGGNDFLSLYHFGYNTCVQIDIKRRTHVRQLLATLDGASTANLLSLNLANQLRLSVDCRPKSRPWLGLGNGTFTRAMGSVVVSFWIHGLPKELGPFHSTFLVVKDLPFSCVLGNPAIKTLERLREPYPSFTWSLVPESRAIFCATEPNNSESIQLISLRISTKRRRADGCT